MRELGLPGEIRFAAYNQVFQELLDPAGLFARNTGGVNVVLVRFDDWPAGQAAEFVDAVRAAAGRTAVAADRRPLRRRRRVRRRGAPRRRRSALRPPAHRRRNRRSLPGRRRPRSARQRTGPRALHAALLRGPRHRHRAQDPRHHRAAVQSDRARLRRHAVGRHLRRGWPRRRGARPAAPRAAGVHGARAAREGMLLALCSKNNEEDVAATFRAHPEMPLRLGDFVAQRVNWDTKGAQPRLARRRTRSRPRHLHPGRRQSQGSARRRRPALPRCWPWRCPRAPPRSPISCATSGPSTARASPRKIAAARELYAQRAERVRAAAQLRQPGRVPRVARTRGHHRPDGGRAGGPRRATHAAHQPDERHLHPAHRGGDPAPAPRSA